MGDIKTLDKRLHRLWSEPDFFAFFKNHAKYRPIRVKKGDTIFFEGDEPRKLYLLEKGFVKLYRMSEEGRDTIIYLYGPGSILAIRALTTREKRLRHSAEAMTDVTVTTMPEEDFLRVLQEYPEHIVDLLAVFIDRLNYTERKLEGFILTDTTARVASFLSDLAERFGEKKDTFITIPVPLTHQQVADFVGAFRETVTVVLNRLKKDGILTQENGHITIFNLRKLKQQALLA